MNEFKQLSNVKGLDTFGKFSSIFHKEDNFCDFLFAFKHIKPLLKRVYSKRKNFSKGEQMHLLKMGLHKKKEFAC